jgi:hypothetical protein
VYVLKDRGCAYDYLFVVILTNKVLSRIILGISSGKVEEKPLGANQRSSVTIVGFE